MPECEGKTTVLSHSGKHKTHNSKYREKSQLDTRGRRSCIRAWRVGVASGTGRADSGRGGRDSRRGTAIIMCRQLIKGSSGKWTNVSAVVERVLLGGKMENSLDCARMVSRCSVSCTKLRRKPFPVGQPVLGGLRDTWSRSPSTSADRICFTEKFYDDDPSSARQRYFGWVVRLHRVD